VDVSSQNSGEDKGYIAYADHLGVDHPFVRTGRDLTAKVMIARDVSYQVKGTTHNGPPAYADRQKGSRPGYERGLGNSSVSEVGHYAY
jgi:hypothetical protein